jgi:carbamoyltransferase
MQARLNELKDREDFRPVAPAIPQENLGDWFSRPRQRRRRRRSCSSSTTCMPGKGARIPAACHTDLTARVQTVDARTNPRFHARARSLRPADRRAGADQHLVQRARRTHRLHAKDAAMDAFYSTPLDALVIGNFISRKERRHC